MREASQQKSEVASLLEQISSEYQAAQRGMSGFACGSTRHDFITARMEHLGQLHNELQTLVGESAIALIVDVLGKAR